MSTNPKSIGFDRAAGYYDQTRGLDAQAQAAQTRMLARELRGRGPVLEVGVGTGRIALDLFGAGIPMAGVDLSQEMLRRLVAKAGGRAPFSVARADATRLPFAGARFGAAVVCHVLHLVGDWRRALDELVRVTAPGGPILIDLGGGSPGPPRELRDRFFEAAGHASDLRSRAELETLDEEMASRGRRLRMLERLVSRDSLTPREIIRRLEAGQFANCWQLPEDVRRAAAEATRAWAAAKYGDLDRPHVIELPVAWRAYERA